jgi:hypothetical protein
MATSWNIYFNHFKIGVHVVQVVTYPFVNPKGVVRTICKGLWATLSSAEPCLLADKYDISLSYYRVWLCDLHVYA